jgi:hypothetical protein
MKEAILLPADDAVWPEDFFDGGQRDILQTHGRRRADSPSVRPP